MQKPELAFLFRVAALVGAAALLYFLWEVREAIAVTFGAIVLAIILRALTRLLQKLARLREPLALLLAVSLILLVAMGSVWLAGTYIVGQFSLMTTRARAGEHVVFAYLAKFHLDSVRVALQNGGANMVRTLFSAMLANGLHAAEALLVLVISALYFASDPSVYRRGFARLFGSGRPAVAEGLGVMATALETWLFGQLIVMAIVGMMSLAGLLILGIPGAPALALIAGLSELVPYVGPLASAIPALFVALAISRPDFLWTLALYLGIHLVEGYMISPLLQRHFLRVPPALFLIGLLVFGTIFGVIGIVIAAPLTAALFFALKVFYVKDYLSLPVRLPKEGPFHV